MQASTPPWRPKLPWYSTLRRRSLRHGGRLTVLHLIVHHGVFHHGQAQAATKRRHIRVVRMFACSGMSRWASRRGARARQRQPHAGMRRVPRLCRGPSSVQRRRRCAIQRLIESATVTAVSSSSRHLHNLTTHNVRALSGARQAHRPCTRRVCIAGFSLSRLCAACPALACPSRPCPHPS